jgi:hypothetical protein
MAYSATPGVPFNAGNGMVRCIVRFENPDYGQAIDKNYDFNTTNVPTVDEFTQMVRDEIARLNLANETWNAVIAMAGKTIT